MRKEGSGPMARRALLGAILFVSLGAVLVALLSLTSQAGKVVQADVVKVGLISDVGGFDDGGFNWMSKQGLLRAESELGVEGTLYESESEGDYEIYLQQCADDGNALCISVGFMMGDATVVAAGNNPSTHFAISDFVYDGTYPDNLRGMTFAVEQAAYLAGTLAGLMAESDVAGAVGGMEIWPVQVFMEPYGNGIRCATPGATALLTYTGSFENPVLGAQMAQEQMDKGADVIFGCGGATGSGAILHATEGGVWGVGVDTDQWVTLFDEGAVEGSEKLLTSVMKRLDNAVYLTIDDEVQSQFTSGTVTYDLSVDGVGLAPFHEAEPFVPESVLSQLDVVKQGILEGTIDPWASCVVKVGLISDVGGFDDGGFNWMSKQGLLRAESELGVEGTLYESESEGDYEIYLQQCAVDGNALCISVGFMMGDATVAAAGSNPSTHFATTDFVYDGPYPDNLRGTTFAVEQAAYLAGTLAGLMTESDVAGAVGGMEIPPVQAFIEPYGNGIRCATPDATALLTYTGTFVDSVLGAEVAQEQMDKGADVIFGCGGVTGNGAILHATEGGVWGVGVDTDQWVTLFDEGAVEGSDKLLTSVMKRLDNAVYLTVADEVHGEFTSGTVMYDLAVDGVGLAPFHEAESFVPGSVLSQLDVVEQGLLEGTIDPWQSCTWTHVYLPLILRAWAP